MRPLTHIQAEIDGLPSWRWRARVGVHAGPERAWVGPLPVVARAGRPSPRLALLAGMAWRLVEGLEPWLLLGPGWSRSGPVQALVRAVPSAQGAMRLQRGDGGVRPALSASSIATALSQGRVAVAGLGPGRAPEWCDDLAEGPVELPDLLDGGEVLVLIRPGATGGVDVVEATGTTELAPAIELLEIDVNSALSRLGPQLGDRQLDRLLRAGR
jgi:hypothetical protein